MMESLFPVDSCLRCVFTSVTVTASLRGVGFAEYKKQAGDVGAPIVEENDVNGSAAAIVRLQRAYNFSTDR